jgi:hypothetical protein
MTKDEYVWLLWGIGFAFVLQVAYDMLGEFLTNTFGIEKIGGYSLKSWGGTLIGIIYIVGLYLYIKKVRSESKQKQLSTERSIIFSLSTCVLN